MILKHILRLLDQRFSKERNPGKLNQIFNLMPDPRDKRDIDYVFTSPLSEKTMPDNYIIPRKFHSPVKNQGSIGSCASHVAADITEMEMAMYKKTFAIPLSERWHYYTVRGEDYYNTYPQDSGQYLRDMCKVLNKEGIAPEMTCSYDTSKYNDHPNFVSYMFAPFWKASSYHRIYSIKDIKKSIALNHPVAFGIAVFESFPKNKDGMIPFPKESERRIGGHAMTMVGYNKDNKTLILKNSWGTRWGNVGYAEIPEDYFKDYGYDYWSIRVK